jgi:hypothetical protein
MESGIGHSEQEMFDVQIEGKHMTDLREIGCKERKGEERRYPFHLRVLVFAVVISCVLLRDTKFRR